MVMIYILTRCLRLLAIFYSLLILAFPVASQQSPSEPQEPISLGDMARRQKGTKAGPSDDAAAQSSRSLADLARERQAKKKVEIKITESDSKELFAAIDEVLDFASHDSGMPRHSTVKYRLLGQEDVARRMSEALSENEAAQKLAQDELVLKKLGYLPRDFGLKKSLVDQSAREILAFYEPKTKTMNLTNWVELGLQRPIMAHELTHALQDQNYNLQKWHAKSPGHAGPKMNVEAAESEEGSARSAVIEGQAMIVLYDYLLAPAGRTLADTPRAVEFVEGSVAESYDTSIVIHNGPLVLKDTLIFPYREGLAFELALLKKGGTEMAFAEAFARPPWDTHEILEPEAWLSRQKRPFVALPDIAGALTDRYEAYDSGTLGQLDVRILAQQYGTENDMFVVSVGWQGGSYVVVKRASAPKTTNSTADLAVLYVSQWKTPEAARRFAEVYRKSLAKRLVVRDDINQPAACAPGSAGCGALWASRVVTDEGPIFVEVWPKNTVIITQSFDDETVDQLRKRVLSFVPDGKTKQAASDLSLRLYELPAFRAAQRKLQDELVDSFLQHQTK